jgi:hypothetical protein
VFDRLASFGIDMNDVGHLLEERGVVTFAKSYDQLLETLSTRTSLMRQGSRDATAS